MLYETLVLLRREVVKWVNRRPVLVISIVTPLFWILLFGKSFNLLRLISLEAPPFPAPLAEAFQRYVSSLLVELFGTLDYFTYVTSGILVVFALFQSMFSGVSVVFDKRLGYLTRLLVAPIPRGSIFLAKVGGTLFRVTVLSAVLLLIADMAGFRFKEGISIIDLLGAWIVVLLVASGFTSIFSSIAFHINNQEVLFALANLVNLPLMFTSSAIFPVEQMPEWLRSIAVLNPLTYAADLTRYFLVGKEIGDPITGLAVLLVFASASLLAGYHVSVKGMEKD
ncbi:MAG: ABC transporter permease [Desulfurococcales archaeon]|nr:ABC transporter permease [Desulfurococcales archaeon]